MKAHLKLILAAAFLTFCCMAGAATTTTSPSTVLVVGNAANANSVALVEYYANARKIPAQNELLLNMPAQYTPDNADTTNLADYEKYIAGPIYAKIKTLPHIDYIVLCRNLPIKIQIGNNPAYGNQSVDSCLTVNATSPGQSWYWGYTAPFNSTIYHMYLVTRLDGWSWADAKSLVDNSIAAKPGGLFFIDDEPDLDNYDNNGPEMLTAYAELVQMGVSTQLDHTTTFMAPAQALGGYISRGSDDDHFSAKAYAALRFQPGAIAETIVSSSGSNIRYPQPGASNGGMFFDQSQSAQLIHQGVTGIKGYVAEPYSDAFADPSLLFVNYVSGMNLAEAFYSASCMVAWKDVVLGDPLCRPY